ncbi:hypothetical protein [Aquisphaera insulae]|uniref:hypothetical protein n=1 Tax=Aquisphaera insulae TaxID=2712864 RepID=UPI0013EC684E|nr:hypothetical protein [Aquisphaera insulae]
MGLSPSNGPGMSKRKVRPMLEGLEDRWVLSTASSGLSAVADAASAGGVFSKNFQTFRYRTPQGTNVLIQVVGKGSLEGTTVDSSGALHLLFSKTNSYSKIMSSLHGGTGQADLASIYHRDLYVNGAGGSLSGIGGSVIKMINLPSFNLIAGGRINVTEGINTLALNSVGPATQIQLRELPSDVTAGATSGTTTSTSTSGTSTNVVSDLFLVQSLAGINGEFVSAGNILLQSDPGSPSPPPAPPGVILKISHINGNMTTLPDLQTDSRIFGYDSATGQVLRFSLDLNQNTGAVDTSFAPIQVQAAGSTNPVALSVGRNGSQLVLMVGTGSTITVYNATSGALVGSFATPAGMDMLGSTDTVSVMGNTQTNQLQMIDVAASLAAGTAVLPAGSPSNYTPQAGVSFVGGLTGIPGSNQVYSTIAATFNTLTPTVTQLGELTVNTSAAIPNASGGLTLRRVFSSASQTAIKSGGSYVPVDPNNNPQDIGVSVGSIDAYLASNSIGTNGSGQATNTIRVLGPQSLNTYATIALNAPGPITDLSESFRPDINGNAAAGTGPALIDVQGNIQSLRGLTANGLVLNDTGYLNLVRTGSLSNSVIVAQPIGHVKTPMSKRTNVSLVSTSNRDYGTRGGVTLNPNLRQIGPLSFTNDTTN